ncbi:putative Phage integrase family [Monocercomonoides exilis]|uniref:putative Phage integrase family n=1 Tax=Monocercomonoides exilis TaxID=2049356 RepID=UPI00355A925B|nr:putative Phage integrase family [Monocercomonoides exilis]
MTQDTVRVHNSDGEDRSFDVMHRLSRVEDMIEEISRSQTIARQSGATEFLPTRKVKRERARRRSRSRSSESESDVDSGDLIAKRKQGKHERSRRSVSRTRRREYEEDSDWDSEVLGALEDKEGTEDFTRIFPREWLTPRRQASELRKFIEFCKAGSLRMNEDILNTFIPESEKVFFTGHTDTSWNALARTAISTKGRRDSPEASRAIELLQPALESGFEAAKAIAALTAKELERTHLMEEEKERLRGLFCAYALIADCISRINLLKVIPQSGWESAKGFLEGGMSKEVPENLRKLVESTSFFQAEGDAAGYGASPDSTTGFGPTTARGGPPRRYSSGRSTQGFVYRQLQRRGYGRSFADFKGKKRTAQFQAHSPKDSRRDSDGITNGSQQVVAGVEKRKGERVEREERAALCRETERGERVEREERAALCRETERGERAEREERAALCRETERGERRGERAEREERAALCRETERGERAEREERAALCRETERGERVEREERAALCRETERGERAEREERAALCRETERGERAEREERAALCRETERGEREANYSETNTRRVTVAPGETRSWTEMQKQYVNIGKVVSRLDQEKERERETARDRLRERAREEVLHDTTKTEGDSAYPRVKEQTSERRNEKSVLKTFGIVIEPPIVSAREGSSRTAILDTLEEEGNTQTQLGHKTPGVRESIVIGPPREPLPGRLVNRLSEWKKIGEDKLVSRGEKTQTRVSGDDRDDEQLFIPLGGGTEGRSCEAYTGVRGEVVQSDIHGEKEKRKVEEDTGLQSSERGSAGKAFQDGLPGDSCGTPGGERLDDHPRHIECLSTCQSGRAIQSLSVLQLSRSLLRVRGDAIWSKGRAQSIHEDNETGSVTYQRTVEGKAGDISGRYSPYASRQGCLEIDLTGDSPVPEKSGLDTVGGEAEARTRKERRVFGMAVELREDGSDTPRKEESAAPGGCAKMDSTCKEREESQNKRLSSTPREAEFCETATPTSKLADEANAIHAEAGDSPWLAGMEREQAKESEEKEQTSRTYNGRIRAGMGCSINNINREQRGEDICSRELDPPGERVSDKREGVQSSVEDFGKERSMAERTENRPYSSEDRQHVREMDNPEEERSAIAHSNTESIGEETEQPGHHNSNGTPPGRTEHGSGCTQPDGEKAGLCTEGGESRRDITNNRTENTRYNFRSDCAGALREYLETILREKEERERNTRRRHSASPPVPEKHWTNLEREDEGSPEGTNDSDSASLAGADLDPVTAAWAFDRDTGDLSGVHDTGSEDEKGRLETTPRRGDSRHTGQENIQGRDLFLTWGEYVGAREIAAAILRSQKSERDTWRALRRFKQFLDRESMDDTDPLTTKDAKWIMAEFIETLSNTNLSSGVIYQTVLKVLESINLFRETKIDRKDIEIFLKTYVGDKPRRGKRYKSMWDLTIITRWAESTYDSKDIRTLQRRALILTMIFGALRPAELERMRRETTTFKDNSIQTQVRTKTSGGEIIKVIIRKHPNPRIDAVEALQHWMDYTKTTFKSEHVWFDIKEMQPASLQKIKEELTAILRENEIPESFTAYSIRHAVITHLARQEGADWKAINAYARWAPGSRVGQEYYTVLPVQDTNWILETIGGSVSQRGEDYKIDKMGDMKEGTLEISETEMKDRANELPKAGFGIRKKLTRKRSRGRMNLQSGEERRSETTHSRSSTPRQPSPQKTPSIIPSNICELTGEKDPTPLKKRGKDRRKHSGRSIAQIGDNTEGVTTGPMSPQRYPKKERA